MEERKLLATLLGLTVQNELVRFDSANPGVVTTPKSITGLLAGEQVLGIDYRPATTTLFGLGSSNRLYTINPVTAVATPVGAGSFTPALSGTAFGFDFNPTVDRVRVDGNTGQNLRLNPNNGTAIVDGALAYAAGDPNAGRAPGISAVAYTNSFAGATATTLYGIDTNLDVLVIQNPANAGTLTTVGGLGLDASELAGFDIDGVYGSGLNQAFASLVAPGGTTTGLYTINLATGGASLLGSVGDGRLLRDVATVPQTETFLAVDAQNNLLTFRSVAPDTVVNSIPIVGLQAGERVLGLDVRPANGQVYLLGSTSRLYTIDPITAVATVVGAGPFTPALSGTAFGFDFNPTVDRIRIVSNTTQNLRVNPNDGTAIVDGALAYAAGDPNAGATPNVVAVAYTNSIAGATATTLYGIDTNLDVLVIQNPANAGTLTTVGGLGLNVASVGGFDISPTGNVAFASLTLVGSTAPLLYVINLQTGLASFPPGGTTFVGAIASPSGVVGLAIAPAGYPAAAAPIPQDVTRFGFHLQPTSLEVGFNKPLDPVSAQDLNNYRLVRLGRDRRLGTRDDRTIRLRSASYNASSRSVTLLPFRRSLRLFQRYALTVKGGISGVTDLAEVPISGADQTILFGRESLTGLTGRGLSSSSKFRARS